MPIGYIVAYGNSIINVTGCLILPSKSHLLVLVHGHLFYIFQFFHKLRVHSFALQFEQSTITLATQQKIVFVNEIF